MPVQSLISPTGIRDRINAIRKKYPDLALVFQTLQDQNDFLSQRFRNLSSNVLGLLPAVLVDGSHIKALSLDFLQISGILSANQIEAASITATKLNIVTILVSGLTLTNNSPSAGKVAWSACTVYFSGVAYPISAGNTGATTDVQIYWTVGGGTFSSAASFSPGPTVFGIATNTDGVSDIVWNKLAMSGVQRDNLSFGLITGLQIQPVATASVSVKFTGGVPVNVVSISSTAGGFLVVGFTITNVVPDATTDFALRFSIDGSSPTDIQVMTAGLWTADSISIGETTGTGALIGDRSKFALNFGFSDSLVVDVITPAGIVPDTIVVAKVLYGLEA